MELPKDKIMQKNPSKNLIFKKYKNIILSVVAIFVFILVLLFTTSKDKEFAVNQNINTSVGNETLAELLKLDTDKDGIVDWEESLWGTDKNNPATFGMPDLEYTDNRKKELEIEQVQNDKVLTETDMFAREFFASYTALKTSGLDAEAINNFSAAVGARVADAELPDIYKLSSIKNASLDNPISQRDYYLKIKNLFDKYREFGLGDELEIVNNGLVEYSEGSENADYGALLGIGDAYKNFAKESSLLLVPETLKEKHLIILNSAHNTGISVLNMAKAVSDPLVGLGGVSQYEKHSALLVSTVDDLEEYLLYSEGENATINNDTNQ